MFLRITRTFILLGGFVIGIMLFAAAVFAAGGGGGGGGFTVPPPPSCIEDTWDCTDWSACTLAGQQTRACTLANNCPTAETPKPVESQSCAPVQPQPVQEEEQTAAPGEPEQKPAPPQVQQLNSAQPPREQCTKDEYSCSDWTQCQEDGNRTRSCSLKTDCQGAAGAKPAEREVCPGLRCGHLPKLEERISCRLGLTRQELADEFKVLYFPEYCKVEENSEEKLACIAFYQTLGPCWQMKGRGERLGCAQKAIGLKAIAEELATCRRESGAARNTCGRTLKEKTERLILFSLYELEVQAEGLLERGLVSQDAVATFETFIENKKIQLEGAERVSEWGDIVREARAEWQKFIQQVL